MLWTKALSSKWATSALISYHSPFEISSSHTAHILLFLQLTEVFLPQGFCICYSHWLEHLSWSSLILLPHYFQSCSSVTFSERSSFISLSKMESLPPSHPSLSPKPDLFFFSLPLSRPNLYYKFICLWVDCLPFLLSCNLLKVRGFVLITFISLSSWKVLNKYAIYVVGKCKICWEGGKGLQLSEAWGKHRELTCNKSWNRLSLDFEYQAKFRFYAKMIITEDYLDEMHRMA